jgi:NAD+ diphosphatase
VAVPAHPRYFAFRGRELLVQSEEGRARVPDADAWAALGLIAVREQEIGFAASGERARAVELALETQPPAGMAFEALRRLFLGLDEPTLRLALRAVQILDWDRGNQFCPRCGGGVEVVGGEHATRCAPCGTSAYPRLSPAVIVLVERGDEVLLARSARLGLPMYTTLAGFVEAGETLEDAAHREIFEEAGIQVRDLRYFGSQPWPFPDSLMIGFHATHAAGELRPDPSELVDAGWFKLDAMPPVPPS